MTSSTTNKPGPTFLIIGAQKCGTTSLYNYLIQHPQINPTKSRKEIHFFDTNRYKKGISWYNSQFIDSSNKIAGEATPRYLYKEIVPARVFKHFPQIKLIILLRNPVERAFSQYKMEYEKDKKRLYMRNHREKYTFDDIIHSSLSAIQSPDTNKSKWVDFVERGIYSQQLNRWLQYYPFEQIHIIKSEDFFRDPQSSYKLVLNFLGVHDWNLDNYKRFQYSMTSIQMNPKTKNELESFYKPYNEELINIIGPHYNW
ncbi:sulfotransferase family protein [Alkalihalobacillus hemicellulosilyticus]|uniref:Putative deacetylase sulfotransferase n=1 Tax=Halalkalibacter hemicellulosilyticusJCM 9152 TaxID=1236971 RepID=W4QH29_9BACI|nr:sulfotransferase [Halalkalibacter hemicellulosilyticus]GAE30933.1 putative deacetylase sulfotransferase [Halalkalibacter hemicellulosilyticusJCM 9152]